MEDKCPRCKNTLNKNTLTYEGKREFITICKSCGKVVETKPKDVDPNELLRECPFCLCKGNNLTFEYGRDWAWINCIECNVSMEYTRKYEESVDAMCDAAVDKWNKRGYEYGA